ncbi:hypothetical protein RYX56_05780 [Alkalihalophilus lindianensis]|uniref:Uncharacterized protein n=1 Tax=Alkalihalophilus lindianensis TaxID=1630542 RepID=A0ABU3X7N0_9BACI|nr:hypothetical protein [Alkalihalophilus lindianensis]MDV2683818.1 hypothetical protein [Alkalihalophilus lindianensis]MDV2683884.1 hypothetical protein [Alkalihalophilus lindianensis]
MRASYDYHYGFRALLIIIIWLAFFGTITSTTSETTFFGAILLFLLPLALDYSGHAPLLEGNKKRKMLGLWSALFISAVCMGFSFSNLNLEFLTLNPLFQIIVACSGAVYVVMGIYDWVGYSSQEEIEHRDGLKALSRTKRIEPMAERVQFHKEIGKSHPSKTGTENN